MVHHSSESMALAKLGKKDSFMHCSYGGTLKFFDAGADIK